MAAADVFQLLWALMILIVSAHTLGYLAERVGLPSMVGELAAGIALGPSLLSSSFPAVADWFGKTGSATAAAIPLFSQLGLLLLMFVGGLQIKRLVTREDTRAVAWITGVGVVLPVLVGLALLTQINFHRFVGGANSDTAFAIVACAALAVTSIPVITRIFIDLGLLETRLARIVLCVAVLEDVLLYIAVSLALGIASASASTDVSIPTRVGIEPGSFAFIAWHVIASGVLLTAVSCRLGVLRRLTGLGQKGSLFGRSPIGWTIAWLCLTTMVAMLLGLAPMFGALVAGIACARDDRAEFKAAYQQVAAIATGIFIPIYFASIGLQLNLGASFDWRLTFGLLAVGTLAKFAASFLGARLAGEDRHLARALAVSVNARGGPGIVLATTSLAAGIINEAAFTSLIILAVVTSVAAATWLGYRYGEPAASPAPVTV